MIRTYLIGAGAVALTAAAAIAADVAAHPGGNRELSRAEAVAKVREHFGRLDANKDGAISTDEVGAMHEKHAMKGHEGHGGPMDVRIERKLGNPDEAFARLDANKDGSISREEFAKGREIRIEKRIAMREDHQAGPDGKAKTPMRMHRMGGGMASHMIVMADGDKDGRITLAEAEGLALQHFDQMDANKDGKVTVEERKAARPIIMKMRQIHREQHQEHAPKAS